MIEELALLGLAAGIVYLYDQFTGEEKKAKQRWEASQDQQRRALRAENARIQRQLGHAQNRLEREKLRQTYHTSIELGNSAYALLRDAKTVLNAVNRQIQHINHHREQLQNQLAQLRQRGDCEGVGRCIAELKAINSARLATFAERDRSRAEKDDLLSQVQTANQRTGELRKQLEALSGVARSGKRIHTGR